MRRLGGFGPPMTMIRLPRGFKDERLLAEHPLFVLLTIIPAARACCRSNFTYHGQQAQKKGISASHLHQGLAVGVLRPRDGVREEYAPVHGWSVAGWWRCFFRRFLHRVPVRPAGWSDRRSAAGGGLRQRVCGLEAGRPMLSGEAGIRGEPMRVVHEKNVQNWLPVGAVTGDCDRRAGAAKAAWPT